MKKIVNKSFFIFSLLSICIGCDRGSATFVRYEFVNDSDHSVVIEPYRRFYSSDGSVHSTPIEDKIVLLNRGDSWQSREIKASLGGGCLING